MALCMSMQVCMEVHVLLLDILVCVYFMVFTCVYMCIVPTHECMCAHALCNVTFCVHVCACRYGVCMPVSHAVGSCVCMYTHMCGLSQGCQRPGCTFSLRTVKMLWFPWRPWPAWRL